MVRRQLVPDLNRINILKFPSLVTEMIINEMGFVDALQLSLSSARCKRTTSSARNKTPMKMQIAITPSRCVFLIFEKNDTLKNLRFFWKFGTRPVGKTEQLKIGGMDMENRRVRFDGWLQYRSFTSKNSIDLAMNVAITHLFSVFRCIEVTVIDINFEMLNDRFRVRKALESVKTTSKLFIRGPKFDSDVRFILSNIEVTKHFYHSSTFSMGTTIDDRLNCSEVIEIGNSSWMSPERLWTMNCERIELLRSRFTSDDVMEFLRRWIDGNGKDKISYVNIEHPLGFGSLDFEELNATPWDPIIEETMVRPENSLHWGLSRAMNIQCLADGRVGTISQNTEIEFHFLVWQEKPVEVVNIEEEI
ncbi:Protein CBG19578 [Caenorhabditis briggsae]|uniref:Protein CBG19578 n=1 Tax=Caenorhabditis briggsae TaxID=6238 RepID=A8XVY0_CAEBR|nr:Protein CBG19578 [Caenorhabditis briggsae]CAP36799.2 Protein CBG19578 [Caenorhabditis briggsae]